MKSLEFLEKFAPDKIYYSVDSLLGDGADGQCFSLKNDSSKIVKYSILYDLNYSKNLETQFSKIEKVLEFMKNSNNSCVAKLYDFGLLYKGSRITVVGEQEYIIYFSTYEKLNKLSEDEKKAMHSLLDFFDKNYSITDVKKSIRDMSKYLDFDHLKYLEFYQNLNVLHSELNHNDLHTRNVMKCSDGTIKLIDFDKATFI